VVNSRSRQTNGEIGYIVNIELFDSLGL